MSTKHTNLTHTSGKHLTYTPTDTFSLNNTPNTHDSQETLHRAKHNEENITHSLLQNITHTHAQRNTHTHSLLPGSNYHKVVQEALTHFLFLHLLKVQYA